MRKRKIWTTFQNWRNRKELEKKKSQYKGIRGIKKYTNMINTKGKEYLTFGGETLRGVVKRRGGWISRAKRIEKKLPSRQVFDETVRTLGRELNKKKWPASNSSRKSLNNYKKQSSSGPCRHQRVYWKPLRISHTRQRVATGIENNLKYYGKKRNNNQPWSPKVIWTIWNHIIHKRPHSQVSY